MSIGQYGYAIVDRSTLGCERIGIGRGSSGGVAAVGKWPAAATAKSLEWAGHLPTAGHWGGHLRESQAETTEGRVDTGDDLALRVPTRFGQAVPVPRRHPRSQLGAGLPAQAGSSGITASKLANTDLTAAELLQQAFRLSKGMAAPSSTPDIWHALFAGHQMASFGRVRTGCIGLRSARTGREADSWQTSGAALTQNVRPEFGLSRSIFWLPQAAV